MKYIIKYYALFIAIIETMSTHMNERKNIIRSLWPWLQKHYLRHAYFLNIWKKVIHRKPLKQENYIKIAHSVWLSLYIRDNERVQHPSVPPSTDLSGTQFSTLKSAGLNDPEEPEKNNNTEVKYGVPFPAATQHLTPAVVMYKYLEKVIPRKH
jgi:hypothetical protein